LYQIVAKRIADWTDGNLGAVIGATAPKELEELLSFWKLNAIDIPVLIPGIPVKGVSGGQSGKLSDTLRALRNSGTDLKLHLVNSSSGINYAYEKFDKVNPAQASVLALEELIEEMDLF